ncbi:MAG: pH regulation protein F [Acidobacteria bacterium]|nr:pH regulation protein F [Acidobacteriota bacterium]MDP7337956.1 monovalent cation/H+ antiporter complex subunit F [Vicinamibacterales bacterium]MDP7480924.1 monovalent cation/H+ antiporter complex subunit F [Vicinamibacterales bacterium]MDP7691252.1 monovalent cation/H+ antiporter complex subunit F [Vicinamibacterales bacterium]HJN44361.1 monovalent cation/H+ antiporter complex subunit F [Vicinamibacterales bacterium]
MSLLLASVAVALALVMLLSLYRVVNGPSIFDRLTGLGLIGSKTIVLLVVLGAWTERVDLYVDIALSYGLISFVGTLVLAKYFEVTADSPQAGHRRSD